MNEPRWSFQPSLKTACLFFGAVYDAARQAQFLTQEGKSL
jgi:hypothetical protein